MPDPDPLHIIASHIDIDGTAKPGEFVIATYEYPQGTIESTETNEFAAIRIRSQFNGAGVVISGRPDDLMDLAHDLLVLVYRIREQTFANPALRELYR